MSTEQKKIDDSERTHATKTVNEKLLAVHKKAAQPFNKNTKPALLKAKFKQAALTPSTKEGRAVIKKISKASVQEAIAAEKELREFYKDPLGDGSTCWYLADQRLSYLKKFKKRGDKRKDTYTEDTLHELRALLIAKDLFKLGILPKEVKFQHVYDPEKQTIVLKKLPKELQSIERLFCAIPLHDLDEDYAEFVAEKLYEDTQKYIENLQGISKKQKQLMHLENGIDLQVQKGLTFGVKTYDAEGNVITVKTHGGDRGVYTEQMLNVWAKIAGKALDRNDGLMTRYSQMPQTFSIEKDEEYLAETMSLFMERQPVEDAADRYPALRKYFTNINALLGVSFRCFSAITHHHPSYLAKNGITEIRPETGRVTIHRQLKQLTKDIDFSSPDAQHIKAALVRMLNNFEYEAQREPYLVPLTMHMREQITDAILDVAFPSRDVIHPIENNQAPFALD